MEFFFLWQVLVLPSVPNTAELLQGLQTIKKNPPWTLLSSSGFCICLFLNFLGTSSGARVQCWNEKSTGYEEFQSWKVLATLQVVTRLEGSEGSSAWMRPGGGSTLRPPQKFDLGKKHALFWKV